jgi:hypothetical protein
MVKACDVRDGAVYNFRRDRGRKVEGLIALTRTVCLLLGGLRPGEKSGPSGRFLQRDTPRPSSQPPTPGFASSGQVDKLMVAH